MDAIIVTSGTAEEIAALVVGLQGRQSLEITDDAVIKDIAKAIYDIRPEAPERSDS